MNDIYQKRESEVRSYCRHFPTIFEKALNDTLIDDNGRKYIDFFAGAGAMNFGHNNPYIKKKVIEYLEHDNIIHALDMHTVSKGEFLETFQEMILKPRNLDYKVMCCGPTGTNAVEAAFKLARKNTHRTNIIAFSGGFHGMTLGSLSATSSRRSRSGSNVPLTNVSFVPFATDFYDYHDSFNYLKWVITDDHSGVDLPAAIIVETIQAEGGVNVAPVEWLQMVRKLCTEHNIIMIVDDIQVGIGRNSTFFSWERAGIKPDMVTLSKSISGFGLPMSLLLIKPELDIFSPSEHNGTFRGLQLSFIASKAAIEYFVQNSLSDIVDENSKKIKEYLSEKIESLDERISVRGSGMIWGIDFSKISPEVSGAVSRKCFEKGLVIETAGRSDSVLKILPPLTIERKNLRKGLEIIHDSICEVLEEFSKEELPV